METLPPPPVSSKPAVTVESMPVNTGAKPEQRLPEQLEANGLPQFLEVSAGKGVKGHTDVPLGLLDPLQKKEDGFEVGGVQGDLLSVISFGKTKVGIVDTKREKGYGDDYYLDDERFMFVGVEVGSGNQIVVNEGVSAAGAYAKEPDTSIKIGRKFNPYSFEQAGIDVAADEQMSRVHGSFRLSESGQLSVVDEGSMNGTGLLVRPALQEQLEVNEEASAERAKPLGGTALITTADVPATRVAKEEASVPKFEYRDFGPDFFAASQVEVDELVRQKGNGGKELNPDYVRNQTNAREYLVRQLRVGMYESPDLFLKTMREAHKLAGAANIYDQVGDGGFGLSESRLGEMRTDNMQNNRRGPAKTVAQLAERYGDPYEDRFRRRQTSETTTSAVLLEGIPERGLPNDELEYDDEGKPLETYDDKGRPLGYTFNYPEADTLGDYFRMAQEAGLRFQSEADKAQPNMLTALTAIAEQYQYMACARPFDQINNSLFMNLANAQIKLLGFQGLTHGDMDHAAHRLQPKAFARYFRDRVHGRVE